MAARRAVVLVGGEQKELPAADTLTAPDTGTDSERFGAGTSAPGTSSLAVGANAQAGDGSPGSGDESVAVGSGSPGFGAIADGARSVVVGNQANDNGGDDTTLVGWSAVGQDGVGGPAPKGTGIGAGSIVAPDGVAIGYQANVTGTGGLALGKDASAGANEMVAGSSLTPLNRGRIRRTNGLAEVEQTIFQGTADKTVSNDTAETSILPAGQGSKTLEADALAAGRTLRITVRGVYSTDVVAPTLRIRARIGGVAGTVVADTGAQLMMAGATNRYFEVSVVITCRTAGAAGTVQAQGMTTLSTSATAASFLDMENTGTQTIDTTAAQALEVTAEWGTADADNSIKATNALIELL